LDTHLAYLWENRMPPFHGLFVSQKDVVDCVPEKLVKNSKHLNTTALKFLKNTARAINLGQHHTNAGRLYLWSLKDHEDMAAKPGKWRATAYDQCMTPEVWEAALDNLGPSDFPDDLPDETNIVSLVSPSSGVSTRGRPRKSLKGFPDKANGTEDMDPLA
jgi:hypothetical protein